MNDKKKNGNEMPNKHLHELLVDELRHMLSAEKQLKKGLEKMAKAARNEKLKEAFQEHQQQTEGHIEKIKEVFQELGMSSRARKCVAIEGLIKEAEEIADDFEGSEALDAALIAAAQRIEHYEIASYGCMVTYADLMEHEQTKKLLGEILNEEKETDEKLTQIAMGSANKGEES